MTSQFAISTSRRRSPAYCLKGKWYNVPSDPGGRPSGINVFVRWFNDTGTDLIDFSETLHAVRNAANNGYIAWSGASYPRIGVAIADTADLTRYDVTVHVDLWGWITDSHTFLDVDATFRQPWGTTLLAFNTIADRVYIQTRLLA
ncbi:hypothetical protein LCGC14_1554910 [marine sediment metagenome]|uniref:Uncharacterized protein n=1 Tax=marine sediment metagenome TaxID=412755 RepID=A0A0F9LQ00_9ZZZZ